jgi:AcrR family transcriptional regulator
LWAHQRWYAAAIPPYNRNAMARKARTPEQVSQARAQLLDAAATALATQGPRDTTMAQLAKACGVTTPTLYSYFQNKEAVLQAVFETVVVESA